jgi:exopolysaccharide production protein ExoQ
MGTPLAFLICSIGIAGLFFLDRDKSSRVSWALWLPVIWLWIAGSRGVSSWFGPSDGPGGLAATLDGSPMDAAVFEVLIFAGVIVLFQRKNRVNALLKASGPLIIYFVYCLMSVAWSPFPDPSFKRWIKAIGDLVMVLVVVTEVQPIAALRRLFSRLGFVLFPASILLIRYTDLGRAFDNDGTPMNTGVTTNKNSLGLIVYLVSLGALWSVRALLMDKKAPNRSRRLVAQCTMLTFGIVLLQMAHSATSVACFILGGGLMLTTGLRAMRMRPARVHALCLGIVLAGGGAMLFGGGSALSSALGRGQGLSGRSDIWKSAIAAADNPLIGTGFESFWNANAHKVAHSLKLLGFLDMSNLVSAHDGYLEVYLDLGLIGLCLIVFVLISGYRRAGKAFRRDYEVGSLILAYLVTGIFYNITEAGFRLLSPSWIFLLLAMVCANGVAVGLYGGEEKPKILASRAHTTGRMAGIDALMPEDEIAYAARVNSF